MPEALRMVVVEELRRPYMDDIHNTEELNS